MCGPLLSHWGCAGDSLAPIPSNSKRNKTMKLTKEPPTPSATSVRPSLTPFKRDLSTVRMSRAGDVLLYDDNQALLVQPENGVANRTEARTDNPSKSDNDTTIDFFTIQSCLSNQPHQASRTRRVSRSRLPADARQCPSGQRDRPVAPHDITRDVLVRGRKQIPRQNPGLRIGIR